MTARGAEENKMTAKDVSRRGPACKPATPAC
jgi:hypothetical protein